MVTIVQISLVRSRACILLDIGQRLWINKKDLYQSGFAEGVAYKNDDFFQQIRMIQYPRALNCAVSMLARRSCSKGEISSRLLRNKYTEDVVELVLYKLEKEKLVDDKAFCKEWIRCRINRGFGLSVIRRELKMKGIPAELIDASMSDTDGEKTFENALLIARKAWMRIKPGEDIRKSRQKVTVALVRRGYSWDEAQTACKQTEK